MHYFNQLTTRFKIGTSVETSCFPLNQMSIENILEKEKWQKIFQKLFKIFLIRTSYILYLPTIEKFALNYKEIPCGSAGKKICLQRG